MTYYPPDDLDLTHLPDPADIDPEYVQTARAQGVSQWALDIWTACCAWSLDNHTAGWVPEDLITFQQDGYRAYNQLKAAGWIVPAEPVTPAPDGWNGGGVQLTCPRLLAEA